MMLRNWIITACLIMALLLLGCTIGGNPSGAAVGGASVAGGASSLQLAEQQMNLAGVQNAKIIGEGEMVTVSYNPSDVDYEGRIVAEWGAIFGVLEKDYPSASRYKIVQLLGGEPVATITVNASDVRDLGAGRMSIAEFRNRLVLGGSRS